MSQRKYSGITKSNQKCQTPCPKRSKSKESSRSSQESKLDAYFRNHEDYIPELTFEILTEIILNETDLPPHARVHVGEKWLVEIVYDPIISDVGCGLSFTISHEDHEDVDTTFWVTYDDSELFPFNDEWDRETSTITAGLTDEQLANVEDGLPQTWSGEAFCLVKNCS